MNEFTLTDLKRVIDACVGTENVTVLDGSTLDLPFAELGVDSLALYETVTRLQDELNVPISDDDIETLKTPRMLIDFVNGRIAQVAG